MRAALAIALLAPAVASADVAPPTAVEMAPQSAHAQTATVLYFNRCKGGCTIHKSGLNDARTHASQIPMGPGDDFQMSEFAGDDAAWNKFMTCIREVYSPYGVMVTDQQPASGIAYNENIVAGVDREIGVSAGGIAPVTSDCSPYSYVLSFTFANELGPTNTEFVCAVAAQESGHSFGLDHSYEFVDGSSACKDPMSYRGDCGGQRFFRNDSAQCGEYQPRPCRCGALQNSHIKLTAVLGAGTPLTPPPTVSVGKPAAGDQISDGSTVLVTASAHRGVAKLELFLNGYKWLTQPGAMWGPTGQPETTYPLVLPDGVPDGVIDIDVAVSDDIESTTHAPTVRVTKGAPCTSADACAAGQRCDDQGRCLWDPPAGEFGDVCTFPQYCKTGLCSGTATDKICTTACQIDQPSVCPDGFACIANDSGVGVCFDAPADGGCCDSNRSSAPAGIGALAFGFVVLRRRRRA